MKGRTPQRERPAQAAVRDRVRRAKLALGAAAALAFTVAAGLARLTYAGHSKEPNRPLVIPQSMYDVVRQNLLQSGIPMPTTDPPEATTHSS